MSSYSEKFKDPRWQKKRLEVLEAKNWSCENCGAKEETLHVHHGHYEKGRNPWDYKDFVFHVYCDVCHEKWHDAKLDLDIVVGHLCISEDIERIMGYALGLAGLENVKSIFSNKTCATPYVQFGFCDYYRTNMDTLEYYQKKESSLTEDVILSRQVYMGGK